MAISREVTRLLRRRDGTMRVAVVGASADPDKYGSVIVQDLRAKGYDVLPVNPRLAELHGLRVYASVLELPVPVDIVDFVVPPAVGHEVLARLDPAGVGVVWFQPGSFDDALVAAARARFAEVVAGDCIMVAARTA